jgi:two-component system NtrC family response regulator
MQDTIPSSGHAGGPDSLGGPDAAFTSPLPPLKGFKRLMERKYLEILIGQTHGNVQEMLDISGLSRSHFYALLKKNNMAL